jgi:hypothetical protein
VLLLRWSGGHKIASNACASVGLFCCFARGLDRQSKGGVKQACVLRRVNVGNVGRISKVGLPVPDQVAMTVFTDKR